jgi:hypothetical protein
MFTSELSHVPPDEGVSVTFWPIHVLDDDTKPTVGFVKIVTVLVGFDTQAVVELVNVKVAVPALTPVTIPLLSTVATPLLLLVQVPPKDGDKVVVAPTQIEVTPVIVAVGLSWTVRFEVVLLHVVDVLTNVKLTDPMVIGLITPAAVTVATEVLLLVQVPPVDGVSVDVDPKHKDAGAEMFGFAWMVIELDVRAQPVVEFVNVKVTFPGATGVTIPSNVIVAILILFEVQVPPEVGDKVVLVPIQIEEGTVIVGSAFTVILFVGFEEQPEVLVKVKVAVPDATPVTMPALVTVAIDVLLLVQVPPVEGSKVVVDPEQIVVFPVMLTLGFTDMVIIEDALDEHRVVLFVNVKEAVPSLKAVITPPSVIVATALLLLAHVPPVLGVILAVVPTHNESEEGSEIAGILFTVAVTGVLEFETQLLLSAST